MGYRGDDASRTWGDSRRQEPWPPSQGAHAGEQGYEPGGEYPPADEYGVYEQGPRYEGGGQYGGQDEYGGQDGYGGSGGYGGQENYGSGGYSIPGDYGRDGEGYGTNGYGGRDAGGYDRPAGGFPDNDWYADSRGGGFADTSIHMRPIVPDDYSPRDYDPGAALPAPPAIEAAPGEGLTQTHRQRALDDSHYSTAYPGYENVDDQAGQGGYGTGGYPAQGYDDYDDYADFTPDYDVPAPTTANPVYTEPAPTTANPVYTGAQPGYDEDAEFGAGPGYDSTAVIDGYGDGFDGQGAMGDDETGQGVPPGAAPGKPGRAGRPGKGRKGRRKILVLGASALCLIVALGAVYVFLVRPTGEEATANAPLPSPGATSAATAACVKQFGQYCHITSRTDDPKPLTIAELFPPAVANTKDKLSFVRIGTRTDKTCSDALLGSDLISAVQAGKCTQVLRASYTAGSGASEIMGTIGVVNLSTTNQSHYAGKLVGQNDFIDPLATNSGVGANLGKSTGEMQSQFKGHYLILTWAELANEATPTNSDDQKLLQFENDLVAATANIALSQRMVTGQPGTGN